MFDVDLADPERNHVVIMTAFDIKGVCVDKLNDDEYVCILEGYNDVAILAKNEFMVTDVEILEDEHYLEYLDDLDAAKVNNLYEAY